MILRHHWPVHLSIKTPNVGSSTGHSKTFSPTTIFFWHRSSWITLFLNLFPDSTPPLLHIFSSSSLPHSFAQSVVLILRCFQREEEEILLKSKCSAPFISFSTWGRIGGLRTVSGNSSPSLHPNFSVFLQNWQLTTVSKNKSPLEKPTNPDLRRKEQKQEEVWCSALIRRDRETQTDTKQT